MKFSKDTIKAINTIMQASKISGIVITHSPGEFEEWTIEDIECYSKGKKVPTNKDIDRLSYLLFEAFEHETVQDETGKIISPSKNDTQRLHIYFDEKKHVCMTEMSAELDYIPTVIVEKGSIIDRQ